MRQKGLIFLIIILLLPDPGQSGTSRPMDHEAFGAEGRVFQENCNNDGGIGDKMFCIQNGRTFTAPNFPNKTDIDIEMSDVKIIEVNEELKQFTMGVTIMMNWTEHRLILNSNYAKFIIKRFFGNLT